MLGEVSGMLYDAEQAYLDAKKRYEWYRDSYIPYEDDKERVRDRVGTANGRDGCRRGLFKNCQRRIRRGSGDGGEVGYQYKLILRAEVRTFVFLLEKRIVYSKNII